MKRTFYVFLIIAALVSCKKDDPSPTSDPEPSGPSIPEEFQAFEGLFDGEGIGASIHMTEDILILFNSDGDKYAWFEDQEIKIINDIDDSNSLFADCVFDRIGAAAKTTMSNMYLFDDDGARYTYATYDLEDIPGSWDNPEIFTWWTSSNTTNLWGPDNTIPINSVSALLTISNVSGDCFDSEESFDNLWMADANGDELVMFSLENFNWPGIQTEVEDYTAENNCGGLDGLLPFDKISAACRYVKPNLIQDIFFSEDGTQFCYYTVSEGVVSEVYDLY